MSNVIKRDKSVVPYDNHKVEKAIAAAFIASEEVAVPEISTFATMLANSVRHTLRDKYHSNVFTVSVEEIQDTVETLLMFNKFSKTANAYILYRSERSNIRNSDSALMKALDTIVNTKSTANDEKRSNANVDGDTSMGAMLQIGATASKEYYLSHLISKEHADAHRQGYIHIHDLDFYGLTTTCTQIDFKVLAKNGFSTGHGYLREPNSIGSYAALAAIAIQSNQNDQHGGQSIPNFDYAMAEGIRKTFKKSFAKYLFELLEDNNIDVSEDDVKYFVEVHPVTLSDVENNNLKEFYTSLNEVVLDIYLSEIIVCRAATRAVKDTDRQTYQAMEGFIHNLNTMHSRAGAQTPFSSINYGTDTSPEGRMAIKNILLAEEAGLGNGETPIFPIHIFKVKEGVNYFETDPNFDLFRLSWKVSAKRLFPNYVFLDSPFNLQYYQEGHPETEVATMGALAGHEHLYIKINDSDPVDISIRDFFYMCKGDTSIQGRPMQIHYNSPRLNIPSDENWRKNQDHDSYSHIESKSGVYKITYLPEDVSYIGSSRNIRRRLNEHRTCIKHVGGLDAGLYFGDPDLTNYRFEVLEYSDDPQTTEQKYIMSVPNANFRGIYKKFYKDVGLKDKKGYDVRPHFYMNPDVPQDLVNLKNSDIKVLDRDNKWVKVNHVFRNSEMNTPYMMHVSYVDDGKEYTLSCTEDHPLWTGEKFTRADELTTSDKLYRGDGKALEITLIKWDHDRKESFDIGTETGSFIGSDIIMHNCRTRVIGNRCGPEITYGRGNLSFTSINLPRLAIESKGDESIFYKKLNKMLNLVKDQLLDRFEIQAKRHVYNYPFLMGQGVWLDSDKLRYDDYVREVIKHGTLSIGFIGLAETLTALYGQHHGESDEMQKKGLDIISYMRKFCDDAGEETGLNFSLLATPAEGLSGRFTKMDKEKFGTIKGVTDREYYTNSFHVPVWYSISIADKIEKEAPYHALTNAGHITYVEVDGDISNNLDAFETIVRCMHDAHIGYGSINHPVDRDPVCGYVGVIGETCPRCGRKTGEAISLDKLDELRKKYSSVPVYRCNCN